MYKVFIFIFLLFLSSCYSFKETNELAIPPIAKDQLKVTNIEK